MATQEEYTAAANAILAILKKDIIANVPNLDIPFQGNPQHRALGFAPALSGECAKAAVDAYEAEHNRPSAPPVSPYQGKPT